MTLAVTLTVDELRALVREEVRKAVPSGPAAAEILTTAQVALLLDVHAKVVGRYIKEHGLPVHRVGGEYRFLRAEVMAWVASCPNVPRPAKEPV